MISNKIKRLIPFVIFIGLSVFAGMAINRGFVESRTPLVDPAHPKVINNQLPEVTLYSTDWCGYCRAARVYLRRKSVPFVELDIEKDPAANREFQRLGGRGVPLITINRNRLQGFHKKQFESVYLSEVERPSENQ